MSRMFTVCLVLMAVVWSADVARAAEKKLFVSSAEGDDGAAGTSREAPLKTIAAAMKRAEPGTTTALLPGWYEGGIKMKPGKPGQPITLRAVHPGRVFIGRPAPALQGWRPVEGARYTQVAKAPGAPDAVLEITTGRTLRNLPSPEDVEEVAGTFHYDAKTGGIYVHPTDSGPATRHVCYRGWPGYAGMVRVSGSSAVEIDACVMDARRRYMVGLVAEGVGTMPGASMDVAALTVTDSMFLYNWFAVFTSGKGPAVFRNNTLVRCLLLTACFRSETVLRNNIFQDILPRKSSHSLLIIPKKLDSDYNCFAWDRRNTKRRIAWIDRKADKAAEGLAGWQKAFGQGAHSIQADPGYPLSELAGFGEDGKIKRGQKLRISDMILPPNSPCRNAGENGEDIGPRWERFLEK